MTVEWECKKFLKDCHLTSYETKLGQRTFFSVIKLVFWEKHELYLFYCKAIFKDCVLFKWTQPSIETDVIVARKHPFFLI